MSKRERKRVLIDIENGEGRLTDKWKKLIINEGVKNTDKKTIKKNECWTEEKTKKRNI